MNWKKTLIAVPLSLSLLVPVSGIASAHNGETHGDAPSVSTPAADLRASLAHLLSEHAYLAVETMRKGADGAADFEAYASILNENTEDLTAAITSIYGEKAGQQFKEMWVSHIGFFVDYVVASGENNEEGKKAALNSLATYKVQFSQFLEAATGKRLEANALAEGLQMHVNQLIGAFDSYLAKDYAKAYEFEREAIGHMHMVAKGLSNAIVNQYPNEFDHSKAVTPASDLRSALVHLLTEHTGLAIDAMQNGIDGSDSFQASAAALGENTKDLTAAIASIYGEEAGQQFEKMWSEHISFFVDYVVATGANDQAGKEKALQSLAGYRDTFAEFLETATDGRLQADALAQGLQGHVDQLIAAFNQYVAGDYDASAASLRTAYEHMTHPAAGLSGAFVSQFPDEFTENMPTEMPKTGYGGTAEQNKLFEYFMLLTLMATLAAAGVVLRKKLSHY